MTGRHAAEPSEAPVSAPRLLGPAEIRDLAELLDVTPTKKLGQNFVHDANTVRRIVRTAGVRAGESVVEIGPGLGSLTLGLLEAGARVVAVEIDGRLAEQLPRTVGLMAPGAELTVVHRDAMRVLELPGAPERLVANLPYNISVPVLLHFLEHFPSLRSGVVMVQAEVGHRLAAAPGSKVYGSPSVKAAWYGNWTTTGQVSRQVFWPVPNVDSVLVAFERRAEPGDESLRRATFAVVDAAFQQRRKMLRQALASLFGDSATATASLQAAGIAPTARGEELDVAAFVRLGAELPVERIPVRGAAAAEVATEPFGPGAAGPDAPVEPVNDEPVNDEPVKDEPVAEPFGPCAAGPDAPVEPVNDEPVAEPFGPGAAGPDAPVEPVNDEPVAEPFGPGAAGPDAPDEPVNDEPVNDEPVKDEPVAEPFGPGAAGPDAPVEPVNDEPAGSAPTAS